MEAVVSRKLSSSTAESAPDPAENAVELELRAERDLLAAQVSELRSALKTAAEIERQRIRRDLHDGAQHLFLAAGVQMRTLGPLIDSDPVAAKARVEQTVTTLMGAMADLRRLVSGDAPALLAQLGLAGAIDELAAQTSIPVEVIEIPVRSLDAQLESEIYFTVAELLANVVKHAQATKAQVKVVSHSASVVIEVIDDGRGGVDSSKGSGLSGLRGRASNIEVLSVLGGGTLVRAVISKD